jgi:hypothetical protein
MSLRLAKTLLNMLPTVTLTFWALIRPFLGRTSIPSHLLLYAFTVLLPHFFVLEIITYLLNSGQR